MNSQTKFKITMKSLILFLIFVGFAVNAFAADSKEIDQNKQLTIQTNQTINFDALKITFLKTLEDSRCPSDVTCIWEGRASIKLNTEIDGQKKEIILTTGENSTAQVKMYKINLIDLKPYPISTKKIMPEGYIATLDILKNKNIQSLSPLKQFKDGINFKDIKCKQDLVLIQKLDKLPACVTPKTKQILIERGWGISAS
jgi:hypothetical protein